MTLTADVLFVFFIFPLTAEIFLAFIFQDWIEWDRMDSFERFLFFWIFLFITFPALILPSMGCVALFGTMFDSLYY